MSELIRFIRLIAFCGIVFTYITSCSSSNKEKRPSPYAIDSTSINGSKVSIAYSSPGVKKRKIWGDLVPYGNMWRTGANEATIFETELDLFLDGQKIEKGKYAVFTIPENQKWTIIFNKDWNQWGAYNYDTENDALRLTLHPEFVEDLQERMKFSFENQQLIFHWEYLKLSIDISTD